MSAAVQTSAPTTDPDPPRAETPVPIAIGRVLNVVRRLIDYGKQLAATVQQRATAPGFALIAGPFGTTDLAVILARITAGLRRAVALEARLCLRAACGRDLTPTPIPLPAACTSRPARRRVALPETQPADHAADPRLARLPTEEEIAAEVRRRPVGAVIADICRDLGIAPGRLDGAFWNELHLAIVTYGGSLAGFVRDLAKRLFAVAPGDKADPSWPAAPPRLPVPATHPP